VLNDGAELGQNRRNGKKMLPNANLSRLCVG
jgi:hypothetical protein